MSPIHCRRLSAVLSVLIVVVVSYTLGGGIQRVIAADNPKVSEAKSSEVAMIEVPGAFKDLPEGDAITSKRIDEAKILETEHLRLDELSVDTQKGGSSQIEAGDLLDFHATAYCLKGRTASGHHVRPGVIAADPKILPLGTVVHLRAGSYTGTYTVLDTGGRIRGRLIDVYVPTYREARQFGRRPVKIKVLSRAKRTKGGAGTSPILAQELTQ